MIRLLVVLGLTAVVAWFILSALFAPPKSTTIVKPPTLEELTFANQPAAATSAPESTNKETMPTTPSLPPMKIDTTKQYFAILKTTKGDITIELNAKGTPVTVNNFVSLAEAKFYDKTIFHRVMKGFMIQGGDPMGTGRGGPGYRFDDEPFTGEYTRGTVAMANAGPNTNGSQFFIMHADVPLEKNYVIFGRVVAGLDVVDAIASAPVTFANGEKSSPVEPVVVNEVVIQTK